MKIPTYDYYCLLCDKEYSEVKKIVEDTRSICGDCGTVSIRKFGLVPVSFKGSGFYSTDKKGDK